MSIHSPIEAAFALHQAGNIAEAERSYRALLESEPDNLNCLQLLGILVGQKGSPTEAVALLERAVAVLARTGDAAAQHAALYNNLGIALKTAGRPADAIAAYRQGLMLDPEMAELHANLGAMLLGQGNAEHGALSYETAVRLDPTNIGSWCNLAAAYCVMRRGSDAIGAYRRALALQPRHWAALNGLGQTLIAQEKYEEAIEAFRAAAAVDPGALASRINLALALARAGQHAAALDLFLQLAARCPDEPSIHWELANIYNALNQLDNALECLLRVAARCPNEAAVHSSIARIHHTTGLTLQAEEGYRTALRLQPDLKDALLNIGLLLLDTNRPDEAVETGRRLLALDAENTDAHCLVGSGLMRAGSRGAAIAAFRRCLQTKPDHVAALYRLGALLAQGGENIEAASHLKRAVELKPDYPEAYSELGNVLQLLDCTEAARECFLIAQRLRPITTWPAAKAPAAFSILAINAPGAANTPCEYLIGGTTYDSHFLNLMPELAPDIDALRHTGDIIVNLISDVDQGRDILSLTARTIDELGKPVINHPSKILSTDRETVAACLVGIPFCRVPAIMRYSRETICAASSKDAIGTQPFPLLLRKAGTHGGEAFEKVTDPGGVEEFVQRYPAEDYYVTQYADYQSNDGYFRKYRMIFTDSQVFPYHLAIAADWKVHHYTTDMDKNAWMQNEEEMFLRDPARVFNENHYEALRAIQLAIGLEFFGIDCSVDREGNLVVFEVNASMLVHDDNSTFPYKTPHVARIKAAFDCMLAKLAGQG